MIKTNKQPKKTLEFETLNQFFFPWDLNIQHLYMD